MSECDPQCAPFSRRLKRAQQIIRDLVASVQQWASSEPIALVGRIRKDRLQYTVSLEVRKQPNLEDWALRFGEAIHQLRASMDNFLVFIAQESGVSDPKTIRGIQFPIAAKPDEWRDVRSRIHALPVRVQTALEIIQPFYQVTPPEQLKDNQLLLLRDLSNRDKHRAQIITQLTNVNLQQAAAVEFETEEGAAANVPPDIRISVPSFETGGVLYEHNTKGRIARVKGKLDYHLLVAIELPDGRKMEAADLLNNLGAPSLTACLTSVTVRRTPWPPVEIGVDSAVTTTAAT